ncbi:phosphoenolpyruvate synthase [Methanothermus fervidus DSM 2088]|uniref:Phosphoenolpyruvate synthase n=1 Tax=Methanothermus fervidus (strain ATCC 43054 / DSM 2088 / JCM 10308 / V24 S) TaxID=523846 RepID=E3GX96_METFV|nr:phosphoenolpyruvate synthase [Methanothermus fervidus]ADP76928.1 phosphoenolpyruvate synthase [Methanothermus fervidus DSM 2088]
MTYVAFFDEITKDDLELAGGKGANLGEMSKAGIPVPPGFIVTAESYRKFIEETGLDSKIRTLLEDVDVNNTAELQKVSKEIKDSIMSVEMPEHIKTLIIESYNALCQQVGEDEVYVAVRSSATAEDLPEASFAGQQETYLNVKGAKNVVHNVQKCWASLFEARAIFYREQNNIDHFKVSIAVVVQKMVDAEKSGVMFTAHPSTGEDVMVIEASWGLGEGVVSGAVIPDTIVVDKKTGEILDYKVSKKKVMFVRENGGTVKKKVPKELQNERVLDDKEIEELMKIGNKIQEHYGFPQDIEWAIENGNVYILQSRPITTLKKEKPKVKEEGKKVREILVKGLGASPGLASGKVRIVKSMEHLNKVKHGDILVTEMTTPDMVPVMKKASAIVTDEGGVTCHAAIVSRELGIPCVVGTGNATKTLKDGEEVVVDGKKGIVYKGKLKKEEAKEKEVEKVVTKTPPITATEVKVNISIPEAAKKAAATGADGVGLLRTEHMILSMGVHPKKFIMEGKEEELIEELAKNILKVVDAFYPKPVWYRTLDAPTDEFRELEGGEDEPFEHNPMLGWRGIRRDLDEPEILKAEFKAIKKLCEQGYDNIGVMLPLVQHPDEVIAAKKIAREVGLEPHKDVEFGIMVETPSAALIIDDFIKAGIDFVSLGTNDLTQYVLAIDRNNELVSHLYSEEHPAVMKLVKNVIKKCKKASVKTSICGQAGSTPHIVEKLVEYGIDSVSANIDSVEEIRDVVARQEKKLVLKAARKMLENDGKRSQ